jgi:rubrerythrin
MPELSYIETLNNISVAEGEAECYLTAWAEVTPNPEVRKLLNVIALREGEHAKAFAKRLCELGSSVVPKDPAEVAEKMAIGADRSLTDREKFDKLGVTPFLQEDGEDPFLPLLADRTIDIQTGELLGRYISEERDSVRMLRGCYGELCDMEDGMSSASVNAGLSAQLGRIEELLEQLVAKPSKR